MKKVFALLLTLTMILPLCFVGASAADVNVLYVDPSEYQAAGYSSVKDYQQAYAGKFTYQQAKGWGRQGYKGINGMAALCDGNKTMPAMTVESAAVKDSSILYWYNNNTDRRFNASGEQGDGSNGEKYFSLIGYEFLCDWYFNVTDFTLYLDGNEATRNVNGFDILGGHLDENGAIVWEVLWSGENLLTENKYFSFDETTVYIDGTFEKAFEGQYIQIGITSLVDPTNGILYLTEFELNGEVYEKLPAETSAPETSSTPDSSAADPDASSTPDSTSATPDASSAAPAESSTPDASGDNTTSAAPADSTSADTATSGDKGCGSTIAGSILGVVAVMSLGITAIRKKND